MKKTQDKIVISAIKLFNKNGVSNVRLQDIAQQAGISAGNLAYHYKLKRDLIEGVLLYMTVSFREMSSRNMLYVEDNDYFSVVKNYLSFQIGHRFFYSSSHDFLTYIKKLWR
ncbi:MAG: TetR/AcrR family transcriptional regulator [Bacteroidota bacterium]